MWWRYDGICSSFRGLDGPDSSMSLFLFPPDHLNGILLLKNTRVSRVKLMWGFDTRLTNLWCFYLSLSWLYLIDYKTEALLWAGQSLPSAQTRHPHEKVTGQALWRTEFDTAQIFSDTCNVSQDSQLLSSCAIVCHFSSQLDQFCVSLNYSATSAILTL